MKILLILILACFVGTSSLFGQTPEGKHGKIEGEVEWRGQVLIDGDIEITPNSTLSIEAGTTVQIADKDGMRGGWNSELIEIHVLGRLLVKGTPEKPVYFSSEALTESWHGIVLRPTVPSALPSVISGAQFRNAVAAIQVPMSGPKIKDCVFLDCTSGIEVGSAFKDWKTRMIRGQLATPEIRGCRFASCYAGVFAEQAGSPDLLNCVFYRCRVGLGNARKGFSSALDDPGCIVERNAFIENQCGIQGQSLVQNSIFLNNGVGLRLSNFHAKYSTQIDHVAMQSNLFFLNKVRTEGDTGLDNSAILGDPAFVGPLTSLGESGLALPPCLELKATSAARSVAIDGGDLGPMGQAVGQNNLAQWNTRGAKVGTYFALPTEYDGKPLDPKKVARGRPAAGKKSGRLWWIGLGLGIQSEIDLNEVFGKKQAGGFLSFDLTGKKGTHHLEVNGDVETVQVFLNGKEVQGLKSRRRFSQAGLLIPLPLKNGRNSVLLRAQGWGPQALLACAIHGPAELSNETKDPLAPLKISKARLVKKKGRMMISVVFGSPLNWSDAGRRELFEVIDERGKVQDGMYATKLKILKRSKLEISNVPDHLQIGMNLRFKGLRHPDGREYPPSATLLVR